MGKLRAAAVLTGFFGLTVPLMPLQALLIATSRKAARRFPNWYHAKVCRILGVRLEVVGEVVSDRAVLLVCNHTSWLDIPVLSALAPVSFVAKHEVRGWPFVSALARLQRSVFVDRTRRHATGQVASEITERLAMGDAIVLFPEGTTSDGNGVLPFKSSLFGAVFGGETDVGTPTVVQTVAVVYTHLHGIPVGRAQRPAIGWYGDMEMTSHAWSVLSSGPITVTIKVGPPVELGSFADRKDLALKTEQQIRKDVIAILRGRDDDADVVPVEPNASRRRELQALAKPQSNKWT